MEFKNILQNVSKYVNLTKEEEHGFTTYLTRKSFPKKTILLREGEICQFEGYIIEGCIRIYYIGENGQEVTLSFAVEDWWVSDIASFSNEIASRLFIETIEDCEMFLLTSDAKNELLKAYPKFERMFRILVQRNLSSLQNRLINTISQTATQRYQEFLKLYPTIPQRVPQYYIASYLGVSPEFVSKIRKKIFNQKD